MGEEPAFSAPALAFVPVELLHPSVARPKPGAPPEPAGHAPSLPAIAEADEGWGERTSLFGDLEA